MLETFQQLPILSISNARVKYTENVYSVRGPKNHIIPVMASGCTSRCISLKRMPQQINGQTMLPCFCSLPLISHTCLCMRLERPLKQAIPKTGPLKAHHKSYTIKLAQEITKSSSDKALQLKGGSGESAGGDQKRSHQRSHQSSRAGLRSMGSRCRPVVLTIVRVHGDSRHDHHQETNQERLHGSGHLRQTNLFLLSMQKTTSFDKRTCSLDCYRKQKRN